MNIVQKPRNPAQPNETIRPLNLLPEKNYGSVDLTGCSIIGLVEKTCSARAMQFFLDVDFLDAKPPELTQVNTFEEGVILIQHNPGAVLYVPDLHWTYRALRVHPEFETIWREGFSLPNPPLFLTTQPDNLVTSQDRKQKPPRCAVLSTIAGLLTDKERENFEIVSANNNNHAASLLVQGKVEFAVTNEACSENLRRLRQLKEMIPTWMPFRYIGPRCEPGSPIKINTSHLELANALTTM